MADDSNADHLASAGIEYGGWGLLLAYALKRCLQIARVNGIYASLRSPCSLGCIIDTNPGPHVPETQIDLSDMESQSDIELTDNDRPPPPPPVPQTP